MPLSITLGGTDFTTWCYKLNGPKEEIKAFVNNTNGKGIEYPPYDGCEYPTCKFPFYHDKLNDVMKMKVKANGIPMMTIEEWMEHETVKQLLEDRAVVDEILYVKAAYGVKGPFIEEEEAFNLSATMDPAKKPASNRPGKRAGDPNTPPTAKKSTPTANPGSVASGGSTSNNKCAPV